MAFQNAGFQLGRFPLFPELGAKSDPVKQRAAVRLLVTLDWPRDTDKLSFDLFTGDVHNGVSVAAHVNKGQVGRHRGIGELSRFVDVARLGVFETRSNAMA